MLNFLNIRLILLLLLVMTLTSCGGGGGSATPVVGNKWTFLVYMAADNDLELAASLDVAEMIKVGSTANVTVILQFDNRSNPTRRYKVEKGSLALIDELGELNMADPATLRDFITAGVQKYPADNYALVLWDHGYAWQSGLDKQLPSIIEDWGNGSIKTNGMPNRKVAEGIAAAESITGKKLAILGIDACIMASMEAAYEFRNAANIMVASQDLVQGYGWDYQNLLFRLNSNPLMTPTELARNMVESYRDFVESSAYGYGDQTIAAFYLGSAVEAIAKEANSIAVSLKAGLEDPGKKADTGKKITAAYTAAQKLSPPVFVDLRDFAEKLEPLVSAAELKKSLSAAIISSYHGSKRPQTYGMNIVFINLPDAVKYSLYDFDYSNTSLKGGRPTESSFIKDFNWDEMMNTYFYLTYPELMPK